MSIITSIFGEGVGKIFDGIKGIIGQFKLSPEEKAKLESDLAHLEFESQKLMETSFQTEINAKKDIIVAELQYGDKFTKRMRPMIGYFGMLVIFYNYCLIPTIQWAKTNAPAPFDLPTEFWVAWGGIVADGFGAFKAASTAFGGDSCAAGLLIVLSSSPLACDVHPSPAGRDLLAQAIVNVLRTD